MILAKARELGKAIRESDSAKKLEQMESRLALDPTAQQILKDLQELQQRVQLAQLRGVPPSIEDQTAANTLEMRLKTNDTIQKLLEAQEEFNALMDQVNRAIWEGMGGGSDNAPGPDGAVGGPNLILP